MRDKLKKLALVFMALCLLVTAAAPADVKAAEKVALEKKKLTLRVANTAELKLNNVPREDAYRDWDRDAAVTWSSSNEAVATVEAWWNGFDFWDDATCVIRGKKKGETTITAKYKNKKYTCTVTVKKFALSNMEGKNAEDVKALEKLIKKQNLKGADLPTNLDSEFTRGYYGVGYEWDEKGNLTGINWDTEGIDHSLNLQGSPSFSVFKSLEVLYCGGNPGLTGLDVSGCKALTELYCGSNRLKKLDVSKNTALTELHCSNNQLSKLDVSKNTALEWLSCDRNQLSKLDVSKNTALTVLRCGDNQLSKLDVSKNTALEWLSCDRNQLSKLDLSKNKALTSLSCDNNVKVTGYTGERW